MNVSVNWLSELLGTELDPRDAAARLSMLAAPVDAIEPVNDELADIVVALVEEVQQHPNADRLSLCKVNNGSEVVEVVCGAPNVTAGKRYPFAPNGASLPGGIKLKARKIRGIKSNGMLCSSRELALGSDHEGILELDTDAAPGTPLVAALDLADWRLVLDVTANRPDLLCHKGVARELGAALSLPVKLPAVTAPIDVPAAVRVERAGNAGPAGVEIADPDGCPRYMAAAIAGLTVGPSPDWLQNRLRAVGARPVNNVVDATNYMMLELNQPMHAFDLDRLNGGRVLVRRARDGEKIVTLDGEERTLDGKMTMICDEMGPIAIGGVMGGANSEVSGTTTNVLLECACFDPAGIRYTRKALKMSTDASYRFERGTDVEGMADALKRAVGLIVAVAGGQPAGAPVDVYPRPRQVRTIFLRPQRVATVLGVEIPRDEIERHLVSVGFVVAPRDDRLAVQVPGWRPDVTREVDLVEEVARLRGYDSFPTKLNPIRPSTVPDDPMEAVKDRLRTLLTGAGLNEARTLSLGPERDDAVQVLNPLSRTEAYLRADLLTGLTRAVERNWAVSLRDVRLFEIGIVFHPGRTARPDEEIKLGAVVTGARDPAHWSGGGRAPDYDLWDLKGLLEEIGRRIHTDWSLVEMDSGWELEIEGLRAGWAGILECERPPWSAPLYGLEVSLANIKRPKPGFHPVPSTPVIERDLALVMAGGVSAARVMEVMRQTAGALLERVTVFDEYRSVEVGRSVGYRLVFRAPNRTLRDKDADKAVQRITSALKDQLGVELRES